MGIALAEIRDSRADGVITPDEFECISRELTKTVREVLSLKAVVSSQVRDLPKANDFSIELQAGTSATVKFAQALPKSASNE
jgi:hypothetical protein